MRPDKLNLFLEKYKVHLPEDAQKELKSISDEYFYLKQIFNYSDWTISIVDSNGTYLITNPKMQNLIGDVIGKKVGSFSKKNQIEEMINFLKSNPNIDQTSQIVDNIINETHQVFLIQASRLEDKFLLMGSEITEIHELKKQQEFNERLVMLGEMSSFIVHEINNPLNAISMSSELIQMMIDNNQLTSEKASKQVNSILNMIEVISKIISTLKSFSRKNDFESESVSFEKILDQAELILMPKLKKNRIKFHKEIDSSELAGNEIEFLQVIINLISNSIDAIKDTENSWIKIIWKDSQLKVVDSGKGIPEKSVERLFEKFHTTKGNKGNGIGLYLSKEILDKNGYVLNYKLENENTCFYWEKKVS